MQYAAMLLLDNVGRGILLIPEAGVYVHEAPSPFCGYPTEPHRIYVPE